MLFVVVAGGYGVVTGLLVTWAGIRDVCCVDDGTQVEIMMVCLRREFYSW